MVTVTGRGPHPKYSDSGTDVVRYEYLNTSIVSGCLYLESLMMFARHVHIDSSFTLLEIIFSGILPPSMIISTLSGGVWSPK